MTWQVASVIVLCAALAGGFGWYEHSRPPARVLALVAALAALAAIGRLAFAAFPNVKPTTDIVLFSGYTLGGPAGFAVGAVAALVSNVFLGQGPWTPWQMAAWGIVGVAGALLGRALRGREPGRITLAIACGLAGFGFGALMDVYQWTLAAEHTLASYLAVSGTSLGFNIAHAVGNVVFALLIGPAFVRALARYRRRFEVRWLAPVGAATGLLLLLLVGLPAVTSARSTPVTRAVSYLRAAQNADGGFGPAPGASSTALHTGWTSLGLAAARLNPRDAGKRGRSAIAYINAHQGGLSDVGELERTLLVLHAAGLKPVLGGHNLVARLLRPRKRDGSFGTVNHTAFAVLALRAGGRSTRSTAVRGAARWLLHAQNKDGGFGFSLKAASDVDDTGAVLEALAAAGRRSSPVAGRAVRYLRGAQDADGGFAQMAGGDSNSQSTAWAVQGLVAVGRNPHSFKRARDPLAYLISLQGSDGSIRYSRTSTQTPVWVTGQALAALEEKAFPIAPAPRHKARVATPPPRPAAAASRPFRGHAAVRRRRAIAHVAARPDDRSDSAAAAALAARAVAAAVVVERRLRVHA